jgi:hypothetical protein
MFSGQADKGIEMIFTRSPHIPEILKATPRLGTDQFTAMLSPRITAKF